VVAIGDSYAAGIGAGGSSGPCAISALSWTSLVAQDLGMSFLNLSCGGAVLAEVRTQIELIPESAEIVLINAGANDAGSSALLRGCRPGQPCKQAGRDFLARLPAVGRELEEVLRSVDAPGRRIILASYPLGADSGCDYLDETHLEVLRQISGEMHKELGATVERLQRTGVAVEFVGLESFAGHDICDAEPWMNGPQSMLYMHPTAQGYRAIADEALKVLKAN
jgi:lysophospholipase L1-like esterase